MKLIIILTFMLYNPMDHIGRIKEIGTYQSEEKCMADLKMFEPELKDAAVGHNLTVELRCITMGIKE